MTSLSACVAEALSLHVTDVFGVMGNGNAYFLDALPRVGVRFTAMRHEAGGVAAADAYFRASGRLAVATTTYGAGFTNALTPLAEAVQARIPLVLVVGDAPTDGPRAWDVDQLALAAAVGAHTIVAALDDPGADRAVARALTQRTAVVLAIPHDLAASPVVEPVEPVLELVETSPASDISGALALLTEARRPLLLAGRGAWLDDAAAPLEALADRLGALTATTALAAGLFGDSPHDLGIAGGFGSDAAAAVMREADVVVVAGASLSQFTTRFGALFAPDARLLQLDIAEAATHPAVTEFVRGGVRATAEALVGGLPGASVRRWSTVPRGRAAEVTDAGLTKDGRLDPRALATALDAALPADRTIVQDGGHFIGWAPSYWRIPAPNRLIMVGTAYQSIGLGFPSAVGAAVALPETTVVLCTGDGGGLMALPDLETFVRTARSGVVVVFNDAAYGAELHQYSSLDHAAMLIPEVDFAGVGRALGASGAVVRTLGDLRALEEWDGTGVLVLDCRVSRSVVAPYLREWMHAAHLD